MAPSMYRLTRALKSTYSIPGLYYCHGDLILIVSHYIIKLCSPDDKVIALLDQLNDSLKHDDDFPEDEEDQSFSILLQSFVTEVKLFFKVPSSTSTLNPIDLSPNEVLSVFIDLLLEIFDSVLLQIPFHLSNHEDSVKSLQMDLKFLITFLGDKPALQTSLGENKNVLTNIETVANDIGSFLYSFFFTGKSYDSERNDQMNLAVSDIMGKVEQVKEIIKKHCMAGSWKMLTPKCRIVSLFLLDSLLDDLHVLMTQKYGKIIDVKDQVRTTHEELALLRSLLEHIEVQRHPELEGLLIQTSDVAYEVIYILASHAPVWYLTLRLPQVMEKIELIKMPLEQLKENSSEQVSSQAVAVDFHAEAKRIAELLKDEDNPSPKVSLEAQTPPIGKDIFVGLEDEAKEITEILLGNQKEQQIISIWGMPGLGKTTLAMKIYSDNRIVQHFHKRASCVISQTYDKRNTMIGILTSMTGRHRDEFSNLEEDNLGRQLYQCVCSEGIRYLIMLDDVWEDVWSDLHRYFPDNKSGSRILFTTRFKKIGERTSPKSIVRNLRFLRDDECWNLLQSKVFNTVPCPIELADTGMKIAKNCDGLPLAVVVIAAVLANMEKNRNKWDEVAESLSSHISKDNNKCMKILELSYNHLPMHLKPCFLYFGAFEEDREIPVTKLTSQWVAEGFVQKGKGKNSNDVSYGYLTDLINRGLVLVGERRSDGKVKTCYVHDLLREMCLTIADKNNFMKVIQDQLPIYVQHHRLSVLSHSISPFSRPFGLHVRSLLGYLHQPSRFIFSNMPLVKVLDLSTEKWSEPAKFEKLNLLKFLRASSMPSSIGICKNLEYLFMDVTNGHVPNIVLKMVTLKYVHFKGEVTWRERSTVDMSSQKYNLEAFSTLFMQDENDEKILRCSPFLRKLKAKLSSGRYSPDNPYYYPNLGILHQLESLSLIFSANGIVSNLISLPLSLRKLALCKFRLNWKEMKMIGELPNLEVLKLKDDKFDDDHWNPNEGEFQKLRFLKLDDMVIHNWKASSDQFPILEQLVLIRFYTEIPLRIGDIPTLVKLEVKWCQKRTEDSALKILEEQRENGNEELKIIITSAAR